MFPKKILYPLLGLLLLAVGVAVGFKLKLSGGTDPAAYNASISKYDEVLRFVNDNYFEPADNNKLAESVIKGLLEGLDPHSFYIPAVEMKAIDE